MNDRNEKKRLDSHAPPIFLIGTHRSGTTWVGSILEQLPGIAYWIEPRQVWSYGNWRKPDDRLVASDAKPGIKRHIRKRFQRFVESKSAVRFCEKTPGNCLRIPFVHEIFPEGKYVLLLRDGRGVLRSTEEIQQGGAGWDRIFQRVRESSIWELPAYLDKFPWLWRKITGQRLNYWGVRPPGWKDWLNTLSSTQVLARQWADSIERAWLDSQQLPEGNRIVLRYEDLVCNPQLELTRLFDFLEISESDRKETLKRAQESVRPESIDKWRQELDNQTLGEIRPIMEPVLKLIGYQWE